MNDTNDFKDDREAVLSSLERMDDQAETPPSPPLPHSGDKVENFTAAAVANASTVERLASESAVPAAVAGYLKQNKLPMEIVCTPEWEKLDWQAVGITVHCREPLDDDTTGVTGITAAAADYGAMLADSSHPHQLTLSLLPPHHIAVLREQDIYPTLAEVMEKSFAVSGQGSPRARNIICGPSRTADIEQTLTLGAHGPVAVHILIIKYTS